LHSASGWIKKTIEEKNDTQQIKVCFN
jgi:hypothetical protein